jgi:RAQPRD family integrative conjugative element protein
VKMVKKMLLLGLCCTTCSSFASLEQERVYLVQLMHQLDAMVPTILAAKQAQPQNLRVQFHYTAWRDNKGQFHPGLLEEVQAIQQGIREKLEDTPAEPRAVPALVEDYLDKDKPEQANK